jgi:hypothetical protein
VSGSLIRSADGIAKKNRGAWEPPLRYLPIWHNPTSTSARLLEAKFLSDMVLSFRHLFGVGSETEGILKLH